MKTLKTELVKTIISLALLLIAMPFGVYAQTTPADSLEEDNMRKYQNFYLEAIRQSQLGNHDAAVELYGYCLELNPNSPVVLYEMAKYLNYLQQDSLAETYLERAVELSPDNYWYTNALAGIYVKENRLDDAIKVVENLSKKYPGKTDVLFMLIDLYTRNEDYPNVIETLNRLEVKEGKSEQISTEKFRIYVQMKDEKRAYQEIMNLAKEYPNDLRYKVLLGDLYVSHGHMEKAREAYAEVEREDSTNINVMISMADYYNKTGEDSLYQRQVEKLLLNPRLSNDMRLQIMQGLVYDSMANKGDSTKVLSKFRKLLSYPQENTAMVELCVRYMVSIKMPSDSIRPALNMMLDIDPENDMARRQLLSYAIQDTDTAEIYRVCKGAADISMKAPLYYYFLSIVYYQRDDHQMSLQTIRKGLNHINENTEIDIIASSYSVLGDLHHEFGDYEQAFEAYDSCLIYTPNDVGVLNNYAYYLSLLNKDLDKAKEMSAKTIEAEPENPTYIDTYAWILFMLGQYDEAKVHIDKALLLMGDSISSDDSNIIEHAGDIYFKAGYKEEALRHWLNAEKLGSTSATLPKKIKKKKYVAY